MRLQIRRQSPSPRCASAASSRCRISSSRSCRQDVARTRAARQSQVTCRRFTGSSCAKCRPCQKKPDRRAVALLLASKATVVSFRKRSRSPAARPFSTQRRLLRCAGPRPFRPHQKARQFTCGLITDRTEDASPESNGLSSKVSQLASVALRQPRRTQRQSAALILSSKHLILQKVGLVRPRGLEPPPRLKD